MARPLDIEYLTKKYPVLVKMFFTILDGIDLYNDDNVLKDFIQTLGEWSEKESERLKCQLEIGER